MGELLSGWWLVKVVDCGLVDRRGRGLAAGRAARVGSGSVDVLNEEVKRGQVCSGLSRRGLVESSCRHNGAAVVVLFRFDSFEVRVIRSQKFIAILQGPGQVPVRDHSSVHSFKSRRRLTSSAATDEEELSLMWRHGTAHSR